MNKLITLIATLIVAATFTNVSAQSNSYMQDVVYLHNGTVVRGTLTELIPDSIVKISSSDIDFTFPMREVDKITKEPRTKKSTNIVDNTTNAVVPTPKYTKFRAAIGGGLNYRTMSLDDDAHSVFEDLMSGYGIDASLSYFVSKNVAIGLRYNQLISTAKENRYDIKCESYNTLIGPTVYYRFPQKASKYNSQFLIGTTIGYMKQLDEYHVGGDLLKTRGATAGISMDFAYDIGLFGVQLSVITGFLSEYQVSDGYGWHRIEIEDPDDYEDLTRIELTLGFRFNN